MRKIGIILLLALAIATPSYAISFIDKMVCKPVVLRYGTKTLLVDRFSGEVKYVLRNGQYIPLEGAYKDQAQAMYDIERNRKQPNFKTDAPASGE